MERKRSYFSEGLEKDLGGALPKILREKVINRNNKTTVYIINGGIFVVRNGINSETYVQFFKLTMDVYNNVKEKYDLWGIFNGVIYRIEFENFYGEIYEYKHKYMNILKGTDDIGYSDTDEPEVGINEILDFNFRNLIKYINEMQYGFNGLNTVQSINSNTNFVKNLEKLNPWVKTDKNIYFNSNGISLNGKSIFILDKNIEFIFNNNVISKTIIKDYTYEKTLGYEDTFNNIYINYYYNGNIESIEKILVYNKQIVGYNKEMYNIDNKLDGPSVEFGYHNVESFEMNHLIKNDLVLNFKDESRLITKIFNEESCYDMVVKNYEEENEEYF